MILPLEGGHARTISRTFDLMAIAEEEIERAGGRGSKAWGAFGHLCPNELAGYSDDLYRHHCRELIARFVAGEKTEPGTTAECLATLSRTSLNAPLKGDPTNLMARLFRQVYGRDVDGHEGQEIRESFPGALDEMEQEMRRKLSRQRKP